MPKYAKTRTIDGKEAVSKSLDGKKYWQKPTLLTENGNGLVEMVDAVGNYDGAVQSAKFYGKTLKMCQLVNNGDFASTSGWGNVGGSISASNNKLIFTHNENVQAPRIYRNDFSFKNGHKIYFRLWVTSEVNGIVRVGNNAFPQAQKAISANTRTLFDGFATVNADSYNVWLVFLQSSYTEGKKTVYEEYSIYDLTAMEQELISDYASFHALYGKDYYPHGEYLVSNDSKWECRGHNIWDEEWEKGYWNGNTGEPVEDNNRIRCKNFVGVIPNSSYHYNCPTAYTIMFFDSHKNIISKLESSGIEDDIFVTPQNCYYIKHNPYPAYGGTYNNDICVSYSSFTQYEPYHNGGTVDLSAWKGNGIGDVKDEVDAVSGDGVRRFVEIDLGLQNWEYVLTSVGNHRFETVINNLKPSADAVSYPKVISAEYTAGTPDSVNNASGYDKRISAWQTGAGGVDKVLWVTDSEYDDAESFKNAKIGKKVIVEIINPTTEHLTPQPINQQKGYNALRQIDGSLANTEAEVKYYGVGGVASLKFNQLIQNGNFADRSGWSVDYTSNLSVENNIGTLTMSSSQGTGRLLLTNKRQTVVGHKYCLKLSYYVPNGGFTGFLVRHRGPYDNIPLTTIGRWEDAYKITEISSANDILLLTNERVLTVAEEVFLQNVMCIDLTYMYGAGNEPTDVEVVKADCRRIGHPLDVYQPYTPIPQLT